MVVVSTGSVVDVGTTDVVDPEPVGTEVDVDDDGGAVVEGVEVPTGGLPGPTTIGVVDPGFGRQPAGGRVWDGTGPAVGITEGMAGSTTEGGR